jgi:lipoprotein signal peptidase
MSSNASQMFASAAPTHKNLLSSHLSASSGKLERQWMNGPTRQRSFRGLLWTLALVGRFLDQFTKYSIFAWLCPANGGRGEYEVCPGVFSFLSDYTSSTEGGTGLLAWLRTRSSELLPKVNQGALFGLGNESGVLCTVGHWSFTFNHLFAIVSVLAAVAIIYWSTRRATAHDWPLCLSLGLILAGTLGNLYDRIVFQGVRDFLWFHLTNAQGKMIFNYPVFNVADCCLVCGACLLLLQAYRTRAVSERTAVATAV